MSEEKPPIESQFATDPVDQQTPAAGTATKSALPPAVALAFVIIALLGVLIVMNLRGGFGRMVSGSPEITELQAEANALKSQLNRERVAMGLRPLEGNFEPVEDVAARLKKDAETMVALAASYQAMLSDKDAELTAKSAELLRAEQLRQTYASESARLQGELHLARDGSAQAVGLRRDLELMRAQRDALTAELATKGQGVAEDEYNDLKRRLEETMRARDFFEAKVKELEGDLTKAKLFASSENELLPAAVELFRSLRKLEGKPDAEINAEYSSLGVKLGANAVFKLNFATGSSELAPADQELIRNLVAEIPDGDLVLCIGYASETGNVDSNRTLSSDRATTAAELFSSVKRPTQLVQAVYLGQTDRFGSRIPESNQIVEVWRIRKK